MNSIYTNAHFVYLPVQQSLPVQPYSHVQVLGDIHSSQLLIQVSEQLAIEG